MDVGGFHPQRHSFNLPARIMAMWAAGVAGLSINMTSPPTLPAGGTAVFVWAQDNVTANPSQFSLYIVPEGPKENVIDAQLVNAGIQLSGTVTMVVPPDTSLGCVVVILS
jgi:hypothetical protein